MAEDVNTPVVQDTTTAAPSATENQAPDAHENLDSFDLDADDFSSDKPTDTDDSSEDTDTTGTDDTDDTTSDESADTDTDTTPETEKPKGAEGRKDQLNAEIRDLVAKRNQIRTEVERQNNEVYGARSPEEIAEQDGLSPEMAEIQAMREERKLEQYNTQVAEAQLTIESEASRVLTDFPMFNKDSDSYNKDIAESAAELLDQNFIKDENTQAIIGTKLSTYQIYKIINDATQLGNSSGQIKGQKAVKKMMAQSDNVGSAGPKEKSDAFADAFDKEFDRF